jgi:septum formation protein
MLREKLQHKNIILASGSPRRQHFFHEMAIDFSIQIKEIEEIYPKTLQASEITEFLAELKASAFDLLEENDLLITSDTIVWHEKKALGKPKDAEEAFEMLQSLSGKTHEVITSVCFKTKNTLETITETTKVTFNLLSDEAIRYYIATYKPFDKAGAYGIQEWIGLVGISTIEGSYTNVVGLPVEKVFKKLKYYAEIN